MEHASVKGIQPRGTPTIGYATPTTTRTSGRGMVVVRNVFSLCTPALLITAFALTLWSFRMPGTPTEAFWVAAICWGIGGIAWLVRLVRRRARLAYGLLAPLLFAATVFLIWQRVPFRIALRVSEPALLRELARTRASAIPKARQRPRQAGLFPIQYCDFAEPWQGVRTSVIAIDFDKSEFPWGHRGLYYSQAPLSPSPGQTWYAPVHVQGPWYEWSYSGW